MEEGISEKQTSGRLEDLPQDSDSDAYDTDIDDRDYRDIREEGRRSQSRQNLDSGHISYKRICVEYGIIPLRKVATQLQTSELNLNHSCLSKEHLLALSRALEVNNRVEVLNLEGNHLKDGIEYLVDALMNNVYVTKLRLTSNDLGPKPMSVFSDLLQKNAWIVDLDISVTTHSGNIWINGNGSSKTKTFFNHFMKATDFGLISRDNHIGDQGITSLCVGLTENKTLRSLNIRGNDIAFVGCKKLRDCLVKNKHLETLDVSWNNISGPSAVALCKALRINRSLKEINLSWNGFGFDGGVGMEDTFQYNSVLKSIDLTNNRIDFKAVPYISRGLRENTALETLKLGINPISTDGCFVLLKVIGGRKSRISYLSFEGIPINSRIAEEAEKISLLRPFTLVHGGILRSDANFGFKTEEAKDPLTKLMAHLETNNIRVLDMFRMFGSESKHKVTNNEMIKGLKKINAPLDLTEARELIKRVNVSKDGCITYTELSTAIRKHVMKEREKEKAIRDEAKKTKAEKAKILQSDLPDNEEKGRIERTHLYDSRVIGRGAKASWSRIRKSITQKNYLAPLVKTRYKKPMKRFPTSTSLVCLTRPSSHSSSIFEDRSTPVTSIGRLSLNSATR